MYAGFYSRFYAHSIDQSIISIIRLIFILIYLLIFALIRSFFVLISVDKETINSIENLIAVYSLCFVLPATLLISWVYYSFFESSNTSATLGKMAANIVVVDINYNKLSFDKASMRYWSKFISLFTFFIGFAMAVFTKRRQALHDIIAKTYVIKKIDVDKLKL